MLTRDTTGILPKVVIFRNMKTGIFLLLGTNLGDKKANLQRALKELEQFCLLIRKSAVYQSQAWGKIDQPDFYNQVVEINTDLSPHQLLLHILAVEQALGRERKEKWGARIMDIDILLYRNEQIQEDDLVIPHPELQNRRFALVPLSELAAAVAHPVLHQTMNELLTGCPDPLQVIKVL
jgi:2-amino-4-hydroxy-6-hydroxymethyldihydropteridine diphosphokinase